MRCTEARRWISNALANPLSADSRGALDRHLSGCAACAEVARADSAVHAALGSLDAPPGAPPDLLRALDRHLVERSARPAWRWRLFDALGFGSALAIGAAAGLLLGLLFTGEASPRGQGVSDRQLLAEAFLGLGDEARE